MDTADSAFERTTLRKIAWRLLPLIALGYGIAYIDRVNISFAALQMNADLGFSATVYGLGGGLFFLGYALFEVPSNMVLAKVGARLWIARIMATWGLLAMGMMFVQTPMQFYVMRFLLGVAEAGFFPGVLYYVTLWFPEKHRAKAVTGFYFAVPLSSALMGGMAGGLLGMQGVAGLAGWQWLFLVQGAPAVILAVVILFALPDSPATARWLRADERTWLQQRLAADAEGRIGDHPNILRALAHPVVLALTAVNFLMLGSNYAFNLSAPTIVQEATGMSPGAIGGVAVVGSLLGVAAMLAVGWNSDRTGQRHLHLAAPLAAVSLALGVISFTDAPWAVIAAYVVFLAAASTAASQFFLTPGAILHPRSAAVGVAAINAVGQLGSFVLPALWGVARDATGSYHLGLATLSANFALTVVVVLVLRGRTRAAVVVA